MSVHPHDALVRSTFSNVEVARPHLRSLLPAELARAVDWASLRVEPGSFVDEALAEAHSDLLYSATMNEEPALVFVLFEHQSTYDRWLPLRLLHYVASVWKRWLTERTSEAFAPPVVAVVLHHSETGWRAPPELASVFSPAVVGMLGPLLPHFRFVLDDLSDASPEEIAARTGHALGRLTLLAMSSSRDRQKLVRAIPFFRAAVEALEGSPEHRRALLRLWRYLFRAAPADVDSRTVRSIVLEIAGNAHVEDVLTAAEELRNEGRAEGLAKGRAEGRAEGRTEGRAEGRTEGDLAAKRSMLARFLSVRGVELSEVGQARVQACTDGAQLEEWTLRASTANSEREVFGG